MPSQAVKEQLKGYERGLAAAKTGEVQTPRTQADMAVVQAKLKGYTEVQSTFLHAMSRICAPFVPSHHVSHAVRGMPMDHQG